MLSSLTAHSLLRSSLAEWGQRAGESGVSLPPGEEASERRARGAETQATPRLGDPSTKSAFRSPPRANPWPLPAAAPHPTPHPAAWPLPQAMRSKRRVWGVTYRDVSVEVPKGQPVTSLSPCKGALIGHHALVRVRVRVGRAASLPLCVWPGREALSVAGRSSAAPQGGGASSVSINIALQRDFTATWAPSRPHPRRCPMP